MAEELFQGRLVDVAFDEEACQGAGECLRGMPEVFDSAKDPWIDPDGADTLQACVRLGEVVARCPGKALRVVEHVAAGGGACRVQPGAVLRPDAARIPVAAVTVADNPAMRRYEARVDGDLAGYTEYHLSGDLIVFPHTEVDPDFGGRGVGTALAKGALDDVRANRPGFAVVPECDFIKTYIERHPDYADLLIGHRTGGGKVE